MDIRGTIFLLIQCIGFQAIVYTSHAQPRKYGLFDILRLHPNGAFSAGGKARATPPPTTDAPTIPDLPNGPLVNDENKYAVCADIVFANDASCSLNGNVKNHQVSLLKDIASRFQISDIAGARIGAFSFGKYVDLQSKMDFMPDADLSTILAGLDNLKTSNMTCRTIPFRAMQMSRDFFKGANDRDDKTFKDVLIFIGDGWTSPIRTRQRNVKEAKRLKNDNVDILWIKTQAKDNIELINEKKYGGTVDDIELLPIVGNATKIFEFRNGESERVVVEITEYLLSHYTCNV